MRSRRHRTRIRPWRYLPFHYLFWILTDPCLRWTRRFWRIYGFSFLPVQNVNSLPFSALPTFHLFCYACEYVVALFTGPGHSHFQRLNLATCGFHVSYHSLPLTLRFHTCYTLRNSSPTVRTIYGPAAALLPHLPPFPACLPFTTTIFLPHYLRVLVVLPLPPRSISVRSAYHYRTTHCTYRSFCLDFACTTPYGDFLFYRSAVFHCVTVLHRSAHAPAAIYRTPPALPSLSGVAFYSRQRTLAMCGLPPACLLVWFCCSFSFVWMASPHLSRPATFSATSWIIVGLCTRTAHLGMFAHGRCGLYAIEHAASHHFVYVPPVPYLRFFSSYLAHFQRSQTGYVTPTTAKTAGSTLPLLHCLPAVSLVPRSHLPGFCGFCGSFCM